MLLRLIDGTSSNVEKHSNHLVLVGGKLVLQKKQFAPFLVFLTRNACASKAELKEGRTRTHVLQVCSGAAVGDASSDLNVV